MIQSSEEIGIRHGSVQKGVVKTSRKLHKLQIECVTTHLILQYAASSVTRYKNRNVDCDQNPEPQEWSSSKIWHCL